jgi:arsenate reductase (thioredoxin)
MPTNRLAVSFLIVSSLLLLPSVSVLAQPAPTQGAQAHTILFICEHGSAKSIVAAAHFNDVAARNGLPYRAMARGVHPDKEIPPYITSGLAAEGLNIRSWQPKRFSEDDALRSDRIITLGCALPTSKAFAADKLQDWNIPSPSDNYKNASRAISERVALLLRELTGKQALP